MTKKLVYSLSALAVLTSFTACNSQSGVKNQAPDIALSSNNTMPVPKISVSKNEAAVNEVVTFDGSQSTDADGDTLNFEWRDPNDKLLSTDPIIQRLFKKEGTYTMTLYVTDTEGGIVPQAISVKVTRHNTGPNTNQPPVAKAKSLTPDNNPLTPAIDIDSNDTVHLTDDGSYDPDGKIIKYIWTDMDNIVLSYDKVLKRTLFYRPEYDFNHDGTNVYIKTLNVTDDNKAVSSTSIKILVHKLGTNQPPVVDLGQDKHILAGQQTTLRAEAHDPDGVIDYYIWKKAGVVVAEGPDISTLTTDKLAVGTHIYTVTVRDNSQATATASVKVIVKVTGAHSIP